MFTAGAVEIEPTHQHCTHRTSVTPASFSRLLSSNPSCSFTLCLAFMKQAGNETADLVLRRLDEQYQKYKFMELNLSQKKRRLKSQIPEIKQTLEILRHMQKKKDSTDPMETRFLLADNLYAKASIAPTDKVCLWLGANVMLEYDIDEAQALLEKNLSTATRNLEGLEEDLDFLRDQFTTTEVNMARVYNWDVKRRSSEAASKNSA
uniref:Prefoldin subunit 3 n=1 Tax=Callorhinchus milii TaxID=7868 RepID=A0A4W3HJD0_CALMI